MIGRQHDAWHAAVLAAASPCNESSMTTQPVDGEGALLVDTPVRSEIAGRIGLAVRTSPAAMITSKLPAMLRAREHGVNLPSKGPRDDAEPKAGARVVHECFGSPLPY